VPVVVDNMLGVAALLAHDLDAAAHRFRSALAVELPAPALSQINAASYRALSLCERGELDAAEAQALWAVSRASASGLEHAAQIVAAHLTMARVALDRADLGKADAWLTRAMRARSGSEEPHVVILTALTEAARWMAAGASEQALSVLRSTVVAVDQRGLPSALRERLRLTEAVVLARLGDTAAARALLDDLAPEATAAAMPLMSARLLLFLGDVPAALAARRRVQPTDDPRSRVATGLLDAVLALAAHDEDAALERIEHVLAEAAPFTLRQPLLDEAGELRPLLERRLARGTVVPAFLADLLERMASIPGDSAPFRGRAAPPTEREHTVLRYLASTLTNAEIAAELHVSVNTVKTHQRALYRKLGVTTRREAVSRARMLGLL
jgi:LuxR family transcriptional regulator, maltose regulon positive regulatory protein